jgi:GNAT superfamily N-acetyltransferase
MNSSFLEKLIAHEADYFTMAAALEKTQCAWFLHGPELAAYRDANHALRLRDDGRGPDCVARQVITYYRARGLSVTADVDNVAEDQGIGAALRRLGITPVIGEMVCMCLGGLDPPAVAPHSVEVRLVRNETGRGEARDWIETAMSDSIGEGDEAMWRLVADREARMTGCRLYLALWDGAPAAACDLFSADGWGRIDSVVTRPEFRRRGIASALVAYVAGESLGMGNIATYLFTEAGGAGERVYTRLGFRTEGINVFRRHRE